MNIFRQLSVSLPWLAAVFLSMFATVSSASEGTITYIHNDLLGSPVAATNQAGVVIWRESYTGYGERKNQPVDTAQSPRAANKVWYTSRHQDEDTGLVYMGARYYDPALGRFLSVDPVHFVETNSHSFNRYAYANNNPYKFKDPDGRQAAIFWGTAAVGIVGSIYVANCEGCKQNIRDAAGVTLEGIRGLRNWLASESAEGDGKIGASPPIPSDLVGSRDKDSGKQGNRQNNGPLDAANGGTGDAGADFGRLTGGASAPAPAGSNYPPGTQIGANGISLRPGKGDVGPRIDIPANGTKPHETLHY